jgi:hypothetical protein
MIQNISNMFDSNVDNINENKLLSYQCELKTEKGGEYL